MSYLLTLTAIQILIGIRESPNSQNISHALLLSQAQIVACHTGTPTLCLEAVVLSLFIVTWCSGPSGVEALSRRSTGFLHFLDAVGWVIWPIKTVPEMTYKVSSGRLASIHSLTETLTRTGVDCVV